MRVLGVMKDAFTAYSAPLHCLERGEVVFHCDAALS